MNSLSFHCAKLDRCFLGVASSGEVTRQLISAFHSQGKVFMRDNVRFPLFLSEPFNLPVKELRSGVCSLEMGRDCFTTTLPNLGRARGVHFMLVWLGMEFEISFSLK